MRLLTTLALIAGLSMAAGSLAAQDSTQAPTRNVPDSLVAKAKVNEDSARAVAVKRVPGDVQSTALVSRRGRLSWVFGIKRSGRTGTTRVTVNANNGHVVSVARASSKSKSAARRSS
jgi:uncharacterized membrane protein YkoI